MAVGLPAAACCAVTVVLSSPLLWSLWHVQRCGAHLPVLGWRHTFWTVLPALYKPLWHVAFALSVHLFSLCSIAAVFSTPTPTPTLEESSVMSWSVRVHSLLPSQTLEPSGYHSDTRVYSYLRRRCLEIEFSLSHTLYHANKSNLIWYKYIICSTTYVWYTYASRFGVNFIYLSLYIIVSIYLYWWNLSGAA